MLNNVYIWYVTTGFLFSILCRTMIELFIFIILFLISTCFVCVLVIHWIIVRKFHLYICYHQTNIIPIFWQYIYLFLAFLWKYYQCNIRIAETLTFRWKFSQFTVNISQLLILHWEYFQHYVSISHILEICW